MSRGPFEVSGGTKPDSGETMEEHQTKRSRRRIGGAFKSSKPQGGRPGGMVMVAHHPTLSINLLPLRGNAPELEVSGRWGSKFLGLLQRLPYLPYIGQKLPLI